MKILLVGEFSGFFNNLADGLRVLGHEVFLANTGDGLRKFNADYNWKKWGNGYTGKVYGYFDLWSNRRLFKGYDVVQFISPYFIPTLFLNKRFIRYVKHNNSKVFWAACGSSDLIAKYWTESVELRCGVYDYLRKITHDSGQMLRCERTEIVDYENWFIDQIDGVIPTMFEYAEPFRNHPKNIGTIPFPINIDKIEYKENIVEDKVVFYHGITRPEKGTIYIQEAFGLMRDKYFNEAEFICNNQLPYDQYIELVNKTNVILDQTNSFSSGMNGLITMAKGKILMGGGDDHSINELGYVFCPIINITSNSKQICESIEYVMARRNEILHIGAESRRFIEMHHNYIDIARKYIEKWSITN
ncbi:glycosyl transferase family 1 [Tenuifilaceae bacterium CYCD]|nr:glycosyl transferase family 1 [Tenuifilaceae bacterium CYCD]